MIRLPEHPLRSKLHDEINARPYEPLRPPERVSYLAYLVDEQDRARETAHLEALCRHFDHEWVHSGERFFHLKFDDLRLRVEQHEEFTRYLFILADALNDPFAAPALCRVPEEWVEGIPGRVMVAIHAAVLPCPIEDATPDAAAPHFPERRLMGSRLANGALSAYTDFRIHEDGFSRWLLFDHRDDPAQAGRTLLRLLEVETYRMMALLAAPLIDGLRATLRDKDRTLVELTTAVANHNNRSDEDLLEDLSTLAADIESLISSHEYRFSATRAYFNMVSIRLAELREIKIGELATLSGYLNRRLEPARNNCDSSMRWLETLSTRVTNASQMLRTRADVRREQQNHALLAAMNRRSELQLRLQQTVESLSLAGITYAGVSLMGIVGDVLYKHGLFPMEGNTLEALMIPFVGYAVYRGTRHIWKAAKHGA
ncbi:Uncharacterized membrane-anchored protein [Methylomagnum ishizawai]|uniref:Uncharacterized membrane-anchored protein n=1 Tax=Methylomagnum ishizawai TaxID=1760988 RepID=A0A1Y6D6Z9_9GAMM|nr:DUF3422 domain-containing protein [Methylomagnum ishizawai]SMF95655.1 Uncharacterized membrane-anchored protein [Methylomagnum ishizawai]